ncbi:MAG: GAF domain-containing sensor histidine kinase [Chloroflexota bacterium]
MSDKKRQSITIALTLSVSVFSLVYLFSRTLLRGKVSWQPVVVALVGTASLVVLGLSFRRSNKESEEIVDPVNSVSLSAEQSLRNRLEAMHRMAQTLSEVIELPELLRQGLEQTVKALGLDEGQIHLIDDDPKQLMRIRAVFGQTEDEAATECIVKVGECVCGAVAQGVDPVIVEDTSSDELMQGRTCPVGQVPSFASVPLRTRNRNLGVLTVRSCNPHNFALQDVETLSSFASFLAAAIENARIRANMAEKINQLTDQVKELAIIQERKRIGREMHDGVAQLIGLLNLQIEEAKEAVAAQDWDSVSDLLTHLDNTIDSAYDEVRIALDDLRQVQLSGDEFPSILRQKLDTFGRRFGIQTHFRYSNGNDSFCLPSLVELEIHRVFQEALSNIRRHATANNVSLELQKRESIWQLILEDDGKGFDPTHVNEGEFTRHGIATMKERVESLGGDFVLESAPSEGTRITVQIPCE